MEWQWTKENMIGLIGSVVFLTLFLDVISVSCQQFLSSHFFLSQWSTFYKTNLPGIKLKYIYKTIENKLQNLNFYINNVKWTTTSKGKQNSNQLIKSV